MSPIIFDHVSRTIVKVGTDAASVAMWQRLVAVQVRP
jgi:hypothetical protein